MKKLLIAAVCFLAFESCEKCANCTRTWEYHSYITNTAHTSNSSPSDYSSTEIFDVCDADQIENEEKVRTSHSDTKINSTQYSVVDGVATCQCKEK